MKKALRKSSATSDEESAAAHDDNDDETDTELHDSLPHDHQEVEDNKINKKKQSSTKIAEKKRDTFPELIKKLRESAKKAQKLDDSGSVPNNEEKTDIPDVEKKVVLPKKRRNSLIAKTLTDSKAKSENLEFCLVDEKRQKPVGISSKVHPQPEVFTFDYHESDFKKSAASNSDYSDIETNDKMTKSITCKEYDTPKSQSPIYYDSTSPKSPQYATVVKIGKENAGKKPSNKISSFFSLVRAVQLKKSTKPDNSDVDQNSEIPSNPEQNRRKNSVNLRRSSKPVAVTKRDSQASIWSENNIPMILISKTESEECILEEEKKNTSE